MFMPRSSFRGGIVRGVRGVGLFNVSLKCSAHRALWSPSLESRFPFLSLTGRLGLLFFPESFLVMSYIFFSYFFVPLQFLPLSSAPQCIFFIFSGTSLHKCVQGPILCLQFSFLFRVVDLVDLVFYPLSLCN